MREVSQSSITYSNFLNAAGELTQSLPSFASQDALISLYQHMLLTRLFDLKAINLQRIGKLNTYASSLGQEAVSVGIGASMDKEDVFLSLLSGLWCTIDARR